jgi:ABC-type antimicrobial peptide transport system permease subunit
VRWSVVAYAVVGLAAGVIAARYEYRDGTAPDSVGSAGAVGMFVALFWPAMALVLLFGLAAKAMAKAGRP